MSSVGIAERSAALPLRVTNKELLNWLFFAAVIVILLRFFEVGNAVLFWSSVNQINVFVVGAMCVAGWRLGRYQSEAPATGRDIAIAGGLLCLLILMGLLPHLIGFGFFLCVLAFYLTRIDDPMGELRACAIVLMSAATNFLIAPLVFRLFLPLFIRLDAILVGNALRLVDKSIEWRGSTFEHIEGAKHFAVTLIGACSSFNNVSAAVLVHMAWAMALRKHLTYLDGFAVMVTIAVATLLNVIRITLTALGPSYLEFWHGTGGAVPPGVLVFLAVQNSTMILAGYLTARWAGRRDRA